MPVGTLPLNKEVKRSPSLRSEQSSLSDSRHVSFNQDVSIKRIPKKVVKPSKSLPINSNDEFTKKCNAFVNVPPPRDKDKIASEAEEILRQLDDIECSVSPTPRIASPARQIASPGPQGESKQGTPLSSRYNTLERNHSSDLSHRLSKSSSDLLQDNKKASHSSDIERARAMRVSGHSEIEDSPGPGELNGDQDSRLYGLQALSNLDNAVNGGKMNNLKNERSSFTDYSLPSKRNNVTPPKPPRKAPSASPPSLRKSYASQESVDPRFERERSFINNISHLDNSDSLRKISYTETNPALSHIRNSPSRHLNSRQSPSHGHHTDSEILSSPTQVLYATISSDKHKYNGNLKNQNIQTQTTQTGFRPISSDRQIKSRTSSRENILDDPHYRQSSDVYKSSKNGSRSLDRFVDDNKENNKGHEELRARIHVKSPMRYTPERQTASNGRKPYKTTINTATDTIQYKGFSSENLNKGKAGKKIETEHYKVPRNKAPVPAEIIARKGRVSDVSNHSSHYNNGQSNTLEKSSNLKSSFASTSLVRTVESNKKREEYDREGRRIHSDRRSKERNRAYSGYSTSPDREISPGRYAKPKNGKLQMIPRSPSTSPTRPPRTRSSPHREIHVPIRQEHTGRDVERSPSTRAIATSRSPIKKIQKVHNDIKGEKEQSPSRSKTLTLTRNKGDKSGARGVKSFLIKKEDRKELEEDRLSKFTVYRGDNEEKNKTAQKQRRGSTSYELSREHESPQFERERGQSVPPGANIDSMRDFYKSSQYRSMYHLPPSPSRPAPILNRGNKPQTLERSTVGTLHREHSNDKITAPPRRHAKTSISEGEMTDDQGRQERVNRHRNKILNNVANNKNAEHTQTMNRRVISNERVVEKIVPIKNFDPSTSKRGGSHDRQPRRPAPQPPNQNVRRSSVDMLETSHSESESPRSDQASRGVDGGNVRWGSNGNPGQSDLEAEADYRRDLATNTSSVHMEARSRDGTLPSITAPPSIYQQAATLNRNKSGSKSQLSQAYRGRSGERREIEISQDDEEDEVVKVPHSLSREEERRKIIELEEERRRKEMRNGNVSRSGSRASKVANSKLKGAKLHGTTETENESQYSGHSSSSIQKDQSSLKNRYNNSSNGRIKRTGSNATSGSARQVISRKKMPGSVTSSVNSSESENGAQSAISRGTNQSGNSNRSVYLHATAVAEIPSRKPINAGENASNLQKSKKISRSISLLAPFKKQPSKEKEVIYDSSGQIANSQSGKPPRAPPPQNRKSPASLEQTPMSKDRKFASSSNLLQDENDISMSSGYSEQASPQTKQNSKVSRSVSMPKDTRLAGWFKKRKKAQP